MHYQDHHRWPSMLPIGHCKTRLPALLIACFCIYDCPISQRFGQCGTTVNARWRDTAANIFDLLSPCGSQAIFLGFRRAGWSRVLVRARTPENHGHCCRCTQITVWQLSLAIPQIPLSKSPPRSSGHLRPSKSESPAVAHASACWRGDRNLRVPWARQVPPAGVRRTCTNCERAGPLRDPSKTRSDLPA